MDDVSVAVALTELNELATDVMGGAVCWLVATDNISSAGRARVPSAVTEAAGARGRHGRGCGKEAGVHAARE